jgi:hypothetical protein
VAQNIPGDGQTMSNISATPCIPYATLALFLKKKQKKKQKKKKKQNKIIKKKNLGGS